MLTELKGLLPYLSNIFLDFDGVLTDNFVYVDENGQESVRCSRSDSYGLSNLKKAISNNGFDCRIRIISTETNKVVSARASKLGMECYGGIQDKAKFISEILATESFSQSATKILFLGNDLNDQGAMEISHYSAAPADAHRDILKIATFKSEYSGGKGFVRDVCDQLLSGII